MAFDLFDIGLLCCMADMDKADALVLVQIFADGFDVVGVAVFVGKNLSAEV